MTAEEKKAALRNIEYLKQIGEVAIIDDDSKDVKPLTDFCDKYGISYSVFSGKRENFISKAKLSKYRAVFLDLNLLGSGSFEENHKGKVVGLMSEIIKHKNGPYYLFIWSQHQNEYTKPLGADLANQKSLKDELEGLGIDPIDAFNLDKALLKSKPKTKQHEFLLEKFKDVMFPKALLVVALWESLIRESARKTVEKILDGVSNDAESIENIFRGMGKYQTDKDDQLVLEYQYKTALHNLNKVFLNECTGAVYDDNIQSLRDIVLSVAPTDQGKKEKINKILSAFHNAIRILDRKDKIIIHGGIYKYIINESTKKKIERIKTGCHKSYKKFCDCFISEENIKVKLLINPACNLYDKRHVDYQFVVGFLTKNASNEDFKSDIFIKEQIQYENQTYWLILNLQMIINDVYKNEETLFVMSDDSMSEIRQNFASVYSKVGLVDFEEIK